MKKELLKLSKVLAAVMVSAALSFSYACSNDNDVDNNNKPGDEQNPGGEEPGGEDPGKTEGEALASPEALEVSVDANSNMTVSWTHVPGARAYKVVVKAVGEVTEAGEVEIDEAVYSEDELEGTNFSTAIEYGKRYAGSVQSLGDDTHADAVEATSFEHFYYTPPTIVDAGDLAETLPALLAEEEDAASMVEYVLLADREYTLSAPVDFGAHAVTIKSGTNAGTEEEPVVIDDGKHAIVTFGANGTFRTANMITLKDLSIDATNFKPESSYFTNADGLGRNAKGWGIVEGSNDTEALALIAQADKNNYLVNGVTFDGCYIKNLHCNMVHAGFYAVEFEAQTITNCIIQIDNDGSYHGNASILIGSYGGGTGPNNDPAGNEDGTDLNWRVGAVRNITVEKSTVYNIKENNSARMIYWNGNSIGHHFVKDDATLTFENVTFVHTNTGREFTNNNTSFSGETRYINLKNNVYYDCIRYLNKMKVTSCTTKSENNLAWWTGTFTGGDAKDQPAGEAGDDTNAMKEIGGFNWTSFTIGSSDTTELDFTAENGYGNINFKASASNGTQGDPRWN